MGDLKLVPNGEIECPYCDNNSECEKCNGRGDLPAIQTIKSLVRHLRKQYLPKGVTFTISGRYTCEYYIAFIL